VLIAIFAVAAVTLAAVIGRHAYRTDEAAAEGQRFYWGGLTSPGELERFEEAVEQARRARASLSFFESGDEEGEEGE
jgi:hypothetical protein